jgi:hypothetical protein
MLRAKGSQGRAAVSLAVEAGAETPVVVQDAKVLPVVTRGAEALCSMGMGESEVSPNARPVRAECATPRVALSRQGLDARTG